MATPSFDYYWVGKSITIDGSVIFTAYWNDLSPTLPSASSWAWNWLRATWETTYDLSWFQMGNGVCAWTWTYVSRWVAWTVDLQFYLQKYTWWWQNTWWSYKSSVSLSANYVTKWYSQLPIAHDVIWGDADRYKMLVYFKEWSYSWYDEVDFDVTNNNIETDWYSPWLITVRWANLVYTDFDWMKHIVKYDGDYNWSYVWDDNAWKLRVQTGVVRRLYYVDEYWYVRRTYEADNWRNNTSWQWASVGTQYRWSLWTGSWASDWSNRYLCFVNSNWYKMRLMNWNPTT